MLSSLGAYGAIVWVFSVLITSVGLSVILREFLVNLLAGLSLRHSKQLRVGRRLKIIDSQIMKGDVIHIGALQTTMMEVGDGEHLPSVETGRVLKIPNAQLLAKPLLIYGDEIVDEVIAYLPAIGADLTQATDQMRQAIRACGHEPWEVGLYSKDDKIVVHGIFRVKTEEMVDERTRILMAFLGRRAVPPQPAMSNAN